MRWISVFAVLISILTTSCSFADSLSNFDCSTENEVYQLLRDNHDGWVDELYAMGEYPIGGRAIWLENELGMVYAAKPDGWMLEYKNWEIDGRLLVVRTANDLYMDPSDYYGIFGSFGYIYSDRNDLEDTFTEYNFELLSDNIYCYSIDR